MSKFERNLNKLKRDPKAFFVDAIRKRVPGAAPLKSGEYAISNYDVIDGLVVLESEALAAQIRGGKITKKRLVVSVFWK